MIEGLSHLTFVVQDLDRMEELLTTVLGARKTYDSRDHRFSVSNERYFDISGIWVAIIEGKPLPTKSYNHVAFKIADSDYSFYLERVRSLGLRIHEDRPRRAGEGRSIYFDDHDNHTFELHSGTLDERIRSYDDG